jgi:outer membrane protein
MSRNSLFCLCLCLVVFTNISQAADYNISLAEALSIAQQNNRRHAVSQQEVNIAEAQYRQAMSSYWPSVNLQASWERRDQDPSFTLPQSGVDIPTPMGALNVPIPETNVKLFDRDTSIYSLNMLYPLYTGGKRSAIAAQAKVGVQLAQQAVQRTDLQIIYDTKRYYYAAIVTLLLNEIAESTVATLEVTRDVTRAFYNGGSTSVNKRDYLQTEIAMSVAKSMQATVQSNHEAALAALGHAMGLNWSTRVSIRDTDFPAQTQTKKLEEAMHDAMRFNPDVQSLYLGVQAAKASIKEARSDYFPTIALRSSLQHIDNSFDSGLTNRTNRNNWTIGIVLNMPLFNGFQTKHATSAARSRHQQVEEQKLLVEQGIALQLKSIFLNMEKAFRQVDISRDTVNFAAENAELSNRSYQEGILKTEDLIQALLLESIVKSNFVKARHDVAYSISKMDLVLGDLVD